MTLRTVTVDAPPVGQEWSTVVPGNQLWDVVAVYGELNTTLSAGDVSMADTSGHGNNGVLSPNPNGPVSATLRKAGPMAGSFGIQFETDGSPPGPSAEATRFTGPTSMQWAHDFTVEVWHAYDAASDPNISFLAILGSFGIFVGLNADGSVTMTRDADPTAYQTVANVVPRDSAYHLVECVFSLTGTYACYVDGVSVAIATFTAPGARTLIDNSDTGASWSGFNNGYARSSRFALYPLALSAGQCAAHHAQGVGAGEPGYSALVVGDGAQLLWAFDDVAAGIERLSVLAVSDGRNVVGAFPSGAGPFDNLDAQLSWIAQNGAPSAALIGNTITAAIPRLILPAGYVLESETDNLLGTDQWSNVRVLWDDALQNITPGYNPYDYPPGAFLTYRQQGT